MMTSFKDRQFHALEKEMQITEAGALLSEMYRNALLGEKVLSIHVFGIRYANEIKSMRPEEIAILAELPKSYGTEIRKGIKLAKYVRIKNPAG
jgi:hypothetical protein